MKYKFLIAFALLLSSCGGLSDQAKRTTLDTESYVKRLQAARPAAKDTSPVVFTNVPRYGSTPLRLPKGQMLPPSLENPGIALHSPKPLTLREFAALLTRACMNEGITVHVGDATPSAAGGPALSAGKAAAATYRPDFEGSLSQLLNAAQNPYDITWSYDPSTKTLYLNHFISYTFVINALPTESTTSSLVSGASEAASTSGGGSSSSGGGTGSTQSSSASAKLDVWGDIEKTLSKMVPAPNTYSTSKSVGTIMVKGTPSVVRDVKEYVEGLNKILSQRIAIEVTAILVDVTDGDDYGLNLNAVWKDATTGLTAGFAGLIPSLVTQTGTGSIGIINAPAGTSLAAVSGSELFIRAVSTAHRLADYQTGSTVTQNNSPSPIQLTTNQDIVKSIAFSSVTLGATTATAQSTTIPYGYALQVLPRVVGDNRIAFFASLTESDLSSLVNFAIGTSGSLQLATTDVRAFKNELTVASGETLVISGFEHNRVSHDGQGVGSADFPFLGGTRTAAVKRTRIILMLTLTLMPDVGTTRSTMADGN